MSSESKPKKRQRKQKISENANDQWKGGHFLDSLIDYDSLVDKASFNQFNQPKKLSSYRIENSVNEEELETIDHVDDIKKEPTDQDSSKDPFGNCDANVKQENEHFMSLPNKRVLLGNDSSLNSEKTKKDWKWNNEMLKCNKLIMVREDFCK